MRLVILALVLVWAQEGRAPVPSDADQKALEKNLRDLFKDEYKSKDPAVRRVLIQKLLSQSADSKDDAVARYVLLKEAREVALQGAEWALALRASEEIARLYAADAAALRAGVLDRIAKAPIDSPSTARAAAEICLALADQFVAADDYDRAVRALQVADGPSRLAKAALLPILLKNRATEVALIKTEFAKVRSAAKTLQDKPGDPAASLAMGKFLCFAKRDWTRGLPLLAGGSDAKLKELATQDLAAPSDTAPMTVLGNAWWAAADEQSAPLRAAVRDHALEWLGRAWPTAEGAIKTSIREKMKASWMKPGAKSVVKGASSIPPPWGGLGSIPTTVEESPAHWGASSMRVGGLGAPKFPAKPGDEFLLSGWVLTEGNEGAADCLRLDFFGADGQWFAANGPEVPIDRPMWTFVSKTITCPPNTTTVCVVIFRSKANGTYWVDDVSLRKVGDDRELVANGSFEDR
jgi:hypothetical protein